MDGRYTKSYQTIGRTRQRNQRLTQRLNFLDSFYYKPLSWCLICNKTFHWIKKVLWLFIRDLHSRDLNISLRNCKVKFKIRLIPYINKWTVEFSCGSTSNLSSLMVLRSTGHTCLYYLSLTVVILYVTGDERKVHLPTMRNGSTTPTTVERDSVHTTRGFYIGRQWSIGYIIHYFDYWDFSSRVTWTF